MGVATAVIAAAVIGAASSAYAGEQQKKAAESERKRLQAAKKVEEAEAKRIASEARPDEESIEGVVYGSGDRETESVTDFLQPKLQSTTSGLKSTGTSGLGFSV